MVFGRVSLKMTLCFQGQHYFIKLNNPYDHEIEKTSGELVGLDLTKGKPINDIYISHIELKTQPFK